MSKQNQPLKLEAVGMYSSNRLLHPYVPLTFGNAFIVVTKYNHHTYHFPVQFLYLGTKKGIFIKQH